MGRQIVLAFPIDALWRFWSFIESHNEGECWPWRKQGNKLYGNFSFEGETFLAHRLSYALFNGNFDPELVVRHKCDNTRCVNPRHLELGTQKDNKQDGVERERNARGSKHGKSVLKEEDVLRMRAIFEDTDMSDAEVAKLFGCSSGAVGHVRRRESWGWLE